MACVNGYSLTAGGVILTLLIVAGVTFYFIPSMVAYTRDHPHRLAILIVNLLFGASGIGWIGSLIWALVTPRAIDMSIPVRALARRSHPRFSR